MKKRHIGKIGRLRFKEKVFDRYFLEWENRQLKKKTLFKEIFSWVEDMYSFPRENVLCNIVDHTRDSTKKIDIFKKILEKRDTLIR